MDEVCVSRYRLIGTIRLFFYETHEVGFNVILRNSKQMYISVEMFVINMFMVTLQ